MYEPTLPRAGLSSVLGTDSAVPGAGRHARRRRSDPDRRTFCRRQSVGDSRRAARPRPDRI